MMKTTVYPMNHLFMRPAFWGVERDLKEVMDTIENVWVGPQKQVSHEFKENDQAYFLSIDLPGVNQANLDIQLEEDTLVINAIRKKAFLEGEGQEQKITRSYLIPKQVDKDKIQAHCEDGVLYIALPKSEKARPKKIEITQGTSKSTWTDLISERFLKKKEAKPHLID